MTSLTSTFKPDRSNTGDTFQPGCFVTIPTEENELIRFELCQIKVSAVPVLAFISPVCQLSRRLISPPVFNRQCPGLVVDDRLDSQLQGSLSLDAYAIRLE
jgi:hypothetical protein